MANESKVFDRIVVLSTITKCRSSVDPVVIGVITTLDGPRYIQIDEPASEKWSHEQVVRRGQELKSAAEILLSVVSLPRSASVSLSCGLNAAQVVTMRTRLKSVPGF